VLLLNDLVKNTPPDHIDLATLKEAVDKIKHLTSFVNEQKKESEAASVIVNIMHNINSLCFEVHLV
jgi:hypothetical protein